MSSSVTWPAVPKISGAREWDEEHRAVSWGKCEWHGDFCDCPEATAAPRGLSPRPAGAGEPAPEPLTATAARSFGSPPPKTTWSEWKMVSNTEEPKPVLNQALRPTPPIWWYGMVKEWRSAKRDGNLIVEVRLFSDNIIRKMIPLRKVSGMVGKRHYLSSKYEIIINSYGPHSSLGFKFNDSDDALEFQMDMMKVLYEETRVPY